MPTTSEQRTTHSTMYDFKQIMPAPGWHCFGAGYDAATKDVWFFEVPVVGWGITYATRTTNTWDGRTIVKSDIEKDDESEVNLLVFDAECGLVSPTDASYLEAHNTVVEVFAPASGNIDSPDVKDQLRQNLQDKMRVKMTTTVEAA